MKNCQDCQSPLTEVRTQQAVEATARGQAEKENFRVVKASTYDFLCLYFDFSSSSQNPCHASLFPDQHQFRPTRAPAVVWLC